MKVTHAKKLVQHLTHFFPELVELSKKSYTPKKLYRVLLLEDESDVKSFGIDSLSHSIASCFSIASDMPGIIFTPEKTISLDTYLFSFNIPRERILIDFDVCLPLIEDKLKNVLNHNVYNKYGTPIKIKDAIELYRKNNEREIIADLNGLEYTKVKAPHPIYSLRLIAKDFEKLSEKTVYHDDIERFKQVLFPIMPKLEQKKFEVWQDRIEKDLENPEPTQSKKSAGWVPAF